MITNNSSWSLGSAPNKSFDSVEPSIPVQPVTPALSPHRPNRHIPFLIHSLNDLAAPSALTRSLEHLNVFRSRDQEGRGRGDETFLCWKAPGKPDSSSQLVAQPLHPLLQCCNARSLIISIPLSTRIVPHFFALYRQTKFSLRTEKLNSN